MKKTKKRTAESAAGDREAFRNGGVRHNSMAGDAVNHPAHYTAHPSGVECIQITEHMNFCLGNAVKYIWRSSLKGGDEDLRKAIWYLERELKRLKRAELYSCCYCDGQVRPEDQVTVDGEFAHVQCVAYQNEAPKNIIWE